MIFSSVSIISDFSRSIIIAIYLLIEAIEEWLEEWTDELIKIEQIKED